MSKLNKDSVGEGVGVCFLQPMITFIMFCVTLPSHVTPIYTTVCTQARGERAQIHTTQMQTCVSLWFMLHFVSYTLNCLFWPNWCLRNLLELLERAGFLTTASYALVRCVDAHISENLKRDAPASPHCRGMSPKEAKQTKDTNSHAVKSKRNQSLSTPQRI